MNKIQYLNAFKKELRGIDSTTRNNIVLEIESHVNELGNEVLLEERFGSPKELAQQYLEEENISPTVGKKAWGISKKILIAFAMIVILLIMIAAFFAWYSSRDKFDYADMSAPELNKSSANWHSVDWNQSTTINVNQARVIFYWHDENSIRWNCGESQDLNPAKSFKVRHDFCLIFLPKQAAKIDIKQSDVVLINPSASVEININQSKLRLSEKEAKYQFVVNLVHSEFEGLVSDKKALEIITINAEESRIERYEY